MLSVDDRGLYEIAEDECDEDVRLEDPRCSGIMNNRNLSVMRPGDVP